MKNNNNQIQLSEELHDDITHLEVESATALVEIGQWYWITSTDHKEVEYVWLGCVMQIGSNFVELYEPRSSSGTSYTRVHFNDFQSRLKFEPNAKSVIDEKIKSSQKACNAYLDEVKAITARLGLVSNLTIQNPDVKHSTALTVMSGQANVKDYENALIKAKKEDLPQLFDKIKDSHKEIAKWMMAESMPLEASVEQMKLSINQIDDRIFNVSLYAGLTERVTKIADGEAAAYPEKLRVMQRRLYMDEECLLSYQHGGMEFKDIGEFDVWLSQPENRDRVLPFERCMVAMRVRRNRKERESDGSLRDALINFSFDLADKYTYMYIRNGEQIFRMDCDLDFGQMIFPDKSMFNPDESLMVKMSGKRVDKMMSVREYDHIVAEMRVQKALYDQWMIDNPDPKKEGDWHGSMHHYNNPYRNYSTIHESEWRPFDQTNVYFDECMADIEKQVNQYNRIAFIIQGLFDRSEVLHPHPPVKTWEPASFSRSVELVFDANMILAEGELPDFEAYRTLCNSSMDGNSVVVGQEMYWKKKEAEKECRRMDASWRERDHPRPKTFEPYGNDGPGYVARIKLWKPKAQQATFTWYRERLSGGGGYYKAPILTTISVPASSLFNISAYKLGDFKQFFKDPRTRAQYLKWAPMLIAAEEYWAGNTKVSEPV